MKKKLSSFCLIKRRISETPFDQLSAFHCMPLGEQALPVKSDEDAVSKITSLWCDFASS